jgi:hypothetical protein
MISALPLTLTVSSMPGIMNSSPTFALAIIFSIVSPRLLPGRSGMISVPSSMTRTKPGGSPRGDTSALPFASAVPMHRKGERAI